MNNIRVISIGIVLISFGAGLILYPLLPALVASHWGLAGEVNGYTSRFWGAFLIPAISAALLVVLMLIPKIDPLKENIRKFIGVYDRFILIITTFLSYLYALTLLWNLGYQFNMMQYLSPAFALLFYYTGEMVGRAEQNWFIGIRTPWTLSSKTVWEKTHRLGSKLFKLTAAFTLLGVIWPGLTMVFLFVPLIFTTSFTFVYSYLLYRQEKTINKSGN